MKIKFCYGARQLESCVAHHHKSGPSIPICCEESIPLGLARLEHFEKVLQGLRELILVRLGAGLRPNRLVIRLQLKDRLRQRPPDRKSDAQLIVAERGTR